MTSFHLPKKSRIPWKQIIFVQKFDGRSENLKKKVRDAQLNQIPLIVTIGNKEKENNTVSVRRLDGHVAYGVPMDKFIESVCHHIAQRKLEIDLF
jgi:Threonyl-tRNA synthetase